jgi:hypothetical protein
MFLLVKPAGNTLALLASIPADVAGPLTANTNFINPQLYDKIALHTT